MNASILEITVIIFNSLFFIFTIFAIASYTILAIISAFETVEYMKKNSFVNYNEILSSIISPSISIIAPAFNESLSIIENTRSLLSSHYANYDVIIVNDGSTDDSLEKLINAYNLVKIDLLINEKLPTKPIRNGVYKSTNPAFEKLTVVDKENGGKADALNMGLNISKNSYVLCIDVDCLLLEDALQKMIKPFLEVSDEKIIATGGVLRVANSCSIKDGKLLDINLPNKMIERAQILEYLRAFLLGRMAWSRLNGLLVISGAFGMFDKKVVIEVGGYDTNTVGEDMELIVRMRKYMEERKEKYRVGYIPDPLCWTEAPDTYKTLISQRNRWTRGTIETLRKHRKVGFNPKYGALGLLSYPYWFFFERLAPIIEVLGILYVIFLIVLDEIRWDYTFVFISAAYLFTVLFTILAIFSEELTYHQYKKKGIGIKLLITSFLEPFISHPFILYAAITGNVDYYLKKEKGWGKMIRRGFL
ncbi:MAG: glycosyltransferase [Lutibacter sp.]